MAIAHSRQDKKVIKEFATNLKAMRKRANLTQEELSYRAGLSSNYIARLERGEINITLTTMVKLSKAFKTTASKLIKDM